MAYALNAIHTTVQSFPFLQLSVHSASNSPTKLRNFNRIRCAIAKEGGHNFPSSSDPSFADKKNSSKSDDSDSGPRAEFSRASDAYANSRAAKNKYTRNRYVRESPNDKVANIIDSINDISQPIAHVAEVLDSPSARLSLKDLIKIIKGSHWRVALETFEWMKTKESYQPKVIVYNVLINTLARQKKWSIADKMANEMIQEGLQLDNFTYSSLINSSSKLGYYNDMAKWFDHMSASSCIPDEVTYCAAIDAFANAGNIQKGIQIFEEIVSAGWALNEITYCCVVNMYGKAGLYDEADKLFRHCKEKGIKPGNVFYNTMVHIYSSARDYDSALQCFGEMKAAGFFPDTKTFTSLIYPLAKMQSNSVDYIFQQMENAGCLPDNITFNALLTAYRRESRFDDAEKILFRMKSLGLKPCEIAFKEMLRVYAEKGDVEKAYAVIEEMKQEGIALDVKVFGNLLYGFGKAREYKEVKKAFDLMICSGVSSDSFILSGLFMNLSNCGSFEEAVPILHCIRRANESLYLAAFSSITSDNSDDANEDAAQGSRDVINHETENKNGAEEGKNLKKNKIDEYFAGMDALFKSLPSNSMNPLVNPILNGLYNLGLLRSAENIFVLAKRYGAFYNSFKFTRKSWSFRVMGLTVGSFVVALRQWLLRIRERMEQENVIESIEIITGYDSEDRPESKSNDFVVAELEKLGLQFEVVGSRLIFPQDSLQQWLFSDVFLSEISLHDKPVSWLINRGSELSSV